MASPNPIERRLGLLREQYLAFVGDDAARLLRWRVTPDEAPMIDAFVQVEAREGATQDVVLVLEHPFTAPGAHGHALVAEFAHRYDLLRECLVDAGVADASWRPPRPRDATPVPADVAHLRDTGASFHEHHQPLLQRLSLILRPSSVADGTAYGAWLTQAAAALDDPCLRLIVVESADVDMFAAAGPQPRVREQAAALDMPGALHEINAAGGLDSPPGRFRHAYLSMGDAVAARDMCGAAQHAQAAVAIAREQSWPHLVVATHYTLGAAHLGEGEHPAAMKAFGQAEAHAEQAQADGAAWAPQLILQSRLAQGSVCVAAASWPLGAHTYRQRALPVASSMQDLRMQIECLRMAAYCDEQQGEHAQAWEQSVEALGVGARMLQADRSSTTLAYVGEAMLRLCRHRNFRGRESAVDVEMRALLGPDWRPGGAASGDPAASVTEPSPLEQAPPEVRTLPESLQRPVSAEAPVPS